MSETSPGRDLTIVATGSEVGLALQAAEELGKRGTHAAVVSMPCVELFREQDPAYQAEILGDQPRIVVEAGVRAGWDEWMREGDHFVGMSSFGVSAPASDAYRHFGITTDAIVASAVTLTSS